MMLLTPDLRRALRANDVARRAAASGNHLDPDPPPLVKFFNPLGAAIWLATDLWRDDDTLFGIKDLGFGRPEIATFSLSELASVRLPFGLGIERDLHFQTGHRLSTWAAWSRRAGSISAAETFGVTQLMVERSLALGSLLPRIRNLHRKGAIDVTTMRHLTMASRKQQTAWLALENDPKQCAPRGHQLKGWLFGGTCIPVRHALFDTEGMKGIKPDLFDKDDYFADVPAFWTAQYAAIDARRAAYIDAGWSDVVILPPEEHFHEHNFVKMPKEKGGRVYVNVRANGEVEFNEGYVTGKQAKRIERGEKVGEGPKPPRPEITGTTQNYIDLHRHAAVRAALKRIVRDHLDGANGRAKVEGWTPKWLAFPPADYTARGGVGTVEKAALVAAARAELAPKPTDPGAVVALPAPKKPKRRKPAASQPEREAA